MTNEELLLDILEKVANKVDVISAEQIRQGIILDYNTQELKEHSRRSTASEGRLELLEIDRQFIKTLTKILTALGGLALFLAKALPYLSIHL